MGPGFSRLRVAATAGVAGATLAQVFAPPAAAATAALPTQVQSEKTTLTVSSSTIFVFRGFATWNFLQSNSGPLGGDGLGVTATIGRRRCSGNSTSFGCGANVTKPSGLVTGLQVAVNGTVYEAPLGVVDRTGKTIRGSVVKLSGLKTDMRYDLLGTHQGGRSVIRLLASFKNGGKKAVTRTIEVGSSYGQPATSSIVGSSSGNAALEQTDAWFTHTSGTGGNGPAVVMARGDANIGAVTAVPSGSPDAIDTYTLKVKPNKTVRLLYYAVVAFDLSNANAVSGGFSTPTALGGNGHLEGLTATERSQVKNWTLLPPP